MPKAWILCGALLCGCATPLSELPYCPELDYSRTPLTDCSRSDEVERYEADLAFRILKRSQWKHPKRIPVRVEVTRARRVGGVCMGRADAPPGWSDRDRVAASLPDLRRARVAPACLAGTTLDLTSRLVEMTTGLRLDEPHRIQRRCSDFENKLPDGSDMPPGWACAGEQEEVCAIYRDGTRRTFPTYCDACLQRNVEAFTPGRC